MKRNRALFVLCCIFFAVQGCKNGGVTTTTTTATTAFTTTTTIIIGNDTCRYCIDHSPMELHGCRVFPTDTFIHADVRTLPVHPRSDIWIGKLGGSTAPVRLPVGLDTTIPYAPVRYGVPVYSADSTTARVKVYNDYVYADSFSYTGLWPLPSSIEVEQTGDRHVFILETDECASYEMIGFFRFPVNRASAGVRWDLATHNYLPKYASVLASGLPGLALMLRPDEVRQGSIDHVMTFAIPQTRLRDADPEGDFLWPAQSSDGKTDDPDALPIGAWLRLKQSVDTSGFPPSVRSVAEALKIHGVLLVDTGGVIRSITMGIERSANWKDADGNSIEAELGSIDQYVFASDFEVIDAAGMLVSPSSMQIK
jgi:hypothetical protein